MIEKTLNQNEMIVSSTDLKGVITYANKTFCKISEFTKNELYGSPHNIIRAKDMPKTIFKFLWDEIQSGSPVVAFVKNETKNKDKFWWVKALVLPVIKDNKIIKYTSYRTKASDYAIAEITKLYKVISDYEKENSLEDSLEFFNAYLLDRNLTYEKFINKLNSKCQISNEKLLSFDVKQLMIDHILFRSNIISLVEKDIKPISVVKPTCCAFGKKLSSLESEPFSKDKRFLEIKKIHDNVHFTMEEYVNANVDLRDEIIKDVQNDINKIFLILDDLIDNYS